MGKIVTVHVQASSFTYLVQATRANNAPHIACQRSSPSRASFLLSFGPFLEEIWSSRDERVAESPRRTVQRITNRMLGMGTIASVHVQASSFTYPV